jgi:hypothetical protein
LLLYVAYVAYRIRQAWACLTCYGHTLNQHNYAIMPWAFDRVCSWTVVASAWQQVCRLHMGQWALFPTSHPPHSSLQHTSVCRHTLSQVMDGWLCPRACALQSRRSSHTAALLSCSVILALPPRVCFRCCLVWFPAVTTSESGVVRRRLQRHCLVFFVPLHHRHLRRCSLCVVRSSSLFYLIYVEIAIVEYTHSLTCKHTH